MPPLFLEIKLELSNMTNYQLLFNSSSNNLQHWTLTMLVIDKGAIFLSHGELLSNCTHIIHPTITKENYAP